MSDDSPPPEPSPGARPLDRLDSWKDIATYLKRDVSTVQRWEKREAMPVHRHVHEKLGTVYAYRSELDAWWRGRGRDLSQEVPDSPQRTQPDGLILPAHSRVVFLSAAAVLAVLVSVLIVWSRWPGAGWSPAPATAKRPVNPEAYDALLQARYLAVRTTDPDSRAAIALLERAISIDSGFAPAYADLAAALVTRLAYVTPDQTAELEQKAFAAAEKALALDPDLPEAYLARGDLLWSHSHRFAHERAVQEFRRALALRPQSDEAHRRLARVFVHLGFFDEAVHHASLALTINPSDAQALNSKAQAALWGGHDEEALAMLKTIPGPVLPELVETNTIFALHRIGRRDEAAAEMTRALTRHPSDPSGNLPAMNALLLAESDPRRAEALILSVMKRKAVNTSHHAAYLAAGTFAQMGRAAEAVGWLREAADTGFPCYQLFARDPTLDPIRKDPRFVAFMAELNKRSIALRRAVFPDPS